MGSTFDIADQAPSDWDDCREDADVARMLDEDHPSITGDDVVSLSRYCARVARRAYRLVMFDSFLGLALLPYGRARQRALRDRCERDGSAGYTSFYRSPGQLDALVGPVLDRVLGRGVGAPTLLVFACSNGAEAYTLASELLFRRPGLDFTIRASDPQRTALQKAVSARYSLSEIAPDLPVPQEFLSRTFCRDGEEYVVRPAVRERVRFEQADLLDPELPSRYDSADLVFAQNVLCHMSAPLARRAFDNITRLLKPGSFVFLDGMDLDLRVQLTRQWGLEPLDYKVRATYGHSRAHAPKRWWKYYYGSEPYFPLARDKLARYGTIFLVPTAGSSARGRETSRSMTTGVRDDMVST